MPEREPSEPNMSSPAFTSVQRTCFWLLLLCQASLLGWSSYVHSPTHLEVFHLPAGLSHLETSQYDLYRVNPPLVRKIAALPAYLLGEKCNFMQFSEDPHHRAEYGVGIDTSYAMGTRFVWLTILGRWMCIPLILAGSWACFRWSSSLYGCSSAGFISMLLWMTCPYVLGHGSLICPDACAASMAIIVSYFFWRWLGAPSWNRTFWLGILLGLTQLTKFTLLIFYPIWLCLWGLNQWSIRPDPQRSTSREFFMLTSCFVLSVIVINLGYEYDDVFIPLGEYRFQTVALSGMETHEQIPEGGANRFENTWMERIPVPLPKDFVYGLDTQKKDFESGFYSYLNGEWKQSGWWYFHPYALLIKLPLGFLGLLVVTFLISIFAGKYNSSWNNEIQVLLPAVIILTLVVLNTGIGLHSRYCLPALPFLFVWCGKLANLFWENRRLPRLSIAVLLSWAMVSSLIYFPHSLGYFNELIGGPENGYRHLAKSDSSWGQDLLFLKRWMDLHPDATPMHLAHCGPFDPRLAEIEFTTPPVGPREPSHPKTVPLNLLGPKPGYYAIDVCFLLGGDKLSCSDGKGNWYEPSTNPGYDLSYFLQFKPIAWAGYSICIYHITLEDANRVRRELGLPLL
jgi:hypothetical protein